VVSPRYTNAGTPSVDQTSAEKAPCLDVIQKNGYDVFSYGGAKQALPDLAALEREGDATNGCWPHLLSDVYSSLYKAKPTEHEGSEAPEAHKRLIKQTMESLDYDAMRATTRLNRTGAAIATLELGEDLLKQLPAGEPKRDQNDPTDKGWEYLEGCESEGDQGRAVRKMVRSAKRRAQETLDTMQALGYGADAGSGSGGADLAEVAKISRGLRQDDLVRRIALLAGRFRRLALAKAKTKVKRVPDEVVGVELGRDLQRAVPSELCKLQTALAPLVLLRYVQGQLLQYRVEGTDKLANGPIVVCLDESGSMDGDRNVWAKALSLGLLAIAARDKREFAVIRFGSSRECEVHTFGKRAKLGDVIRCMGSFFGGGTSFQRPLDEAMKLIEAERTEHDNPLKRADIVFVTDGQCQLDRTFTQAFKKRKKATNANLYTVYVATRGRSLDELSDGVAYMSTTDRDAEALELAFGI
jgi:uncharacterized protein with von Willebrand factor type A (vWA) domain